MTAWHMGEEEKSQGRAIDRYGEEHIAPETTTGGGERAMHGTGDVPEEFKTGIADRIARYAPD